LPVIFHIPEPFIGTFYCQIAKNTNKKNSLPFSDRLLFLNTLLIFLQQITACLSDFIPQATTNWYFYG